MSDNIEENYLEIHIPFAILVHSVDFYFLIGKFVFVMECTTVFNLINIPYFMSNVYFCEVWELCKFFKMLCQYFYIT